MLIAIGEGRGKRTSERAGAAGSWHGQVKFDLIKTQRETADMGRRRYREGLRGRAALHSPSENGREPARIWSTKGHVEQTVGNRELGRRRKPASFSDGRSSPSTQKESTFHAELLRRGSRLPRRLRMGVAARAAGRCGYNAGEGGHGRGPGDTLSANSGLLFRIIKTAPPPKPSKRFFFPQM